MSRVMLQHEFVASDEGRGNLLRFDERPGAEGIPLPESEASGNITSPWNRQEMILSLPGERYGLRRPITEKSER